MLSKFKKCETSFNTYQLYFPILYNIKLYQPSTLYITKRRFSCFNVMKDHQQDLKSSSLLALWYSTGQCVHGKSTSASSQNNKRKIHKVLFSAQISLYSNTFSYYNYNTREQLCIMKNKITFVTTIYELWQQCSHAYAANIKSQLSYLC